MKVLICAAGIGSRLKPYTDDRPKALVKIGKKTILEYMLDNISSCGIKKVILIVGYESDKVKEFIGDNYAGCHIKYYINEEYGKTDNMFSLWKARDEINEDIIFFNADIIFDSRILARLIDNKYGNAVAIDNFSKLEEDSMKVNSVNGKIKAISKKVQNANGCAIGMYKLSLEGAKKYYKEVENLIKTGNSDASFVRPIEILSKNIDIFGVSSGKLPWAEIDTLADKEEAQKIINKILGKNAHQEL